MNILYYFHISYFTALLYSCMYYILQIENGIPAFCFLYYGSPVYFLGFIVSRYLANINGIRMYSYPCLLSQATIG